MLSMDRRTFLKGGAAMTTGLVISGPLQALAARVALGQTISAEGYGPLVDMGDLFLPEGFEYRIISRPGIPMTDGSPTPTRFDGMAAIAGPEDTTVLIRNHENRRRYNAAGRVVAPAGEIGVVVPANRRYDQNSTYNGGVTQLVVEDRDVIESRALLGGTTTNCAGGRTPWGSWLTCEELFAAPVTTVTPPSAFHGHIFEVDASAATPLSATPIMGAGRFEHEAVAWCDETLYETEDQPDACFYRYTPSPRPYGFGDLAGSAGALEALKIRDVFGLDTRDGIEGGVGTSLDVEWVQVPNPNPSSNAQAPAGADPAQFGVRYQAQSLGAAMFRRTEGCWTGDDKMLFDCTDGGAGRLGQIWELDPRSNKLTLVFESNNAEILNKPDNLTVAPTDDLFVCEDLGGAGGTPHIRGLTPDGGLFDFAAAKTNRTEFCGACFNPIPRPGPRSGGLNLEDLTLYVNQQGAPPEGIPGVTYAIWGPWKRD